MNEYANEQKPPLHEEDFLWLCYGPMVLGQLILQLAVHGTNNGLSLGDPHPEIDHCLVQATYQGGTMQQSSATASSFQICL